MIKTVIKCPDNMVMVFDSEGEQMPKYQDRYERVKRSILKNAPPNAAFWHLHYSEPVLRRVLREEW